MDIALILLACYGLTTILVKSTIMERFREFVGKVEFFRELISCSLCTGFWVGIYFAFVLFFLLTPGIFGLSLALSKGVFYLMTIPFASSGVSWILDRAATLLDDTIYEKSDD